MADISDVESVLAQLAANAVYPNGTAAASVAGVTVTLAAGWPEPKQLDGIIAAGNAMVTVFPQPGAEDNTTRFWPTMAILDAIPAPQLLLTLEGNIISVGGAVNPGEAAFALVNYHGYSYGVKAGDTLASVAASLAALIPQASVSGTTITLNGAFDIEVSVSVSVTMQAEIARQRRRFLMSIWAPSPAIRALLGPAIDAYLKAAAQKRIVLPDDTFARLIYRGTMETDQLAKERLYRRDLLYEVEYVTTSRETDNTIRTFNL